MLKTETILDAGEPLRPLLKTADDWRLLAEYARAIEALVRAECVPQWISVEDGLPPNDGDVLVWHRFNKCASVDRWSVQREDPLGMGGPTIETGYEWDEHHFEEISHWAPLPAAPGITASKGHQHVTTISTMKAWMQAATPDEQVLLAERAGTSRAYLYHLNASDAANYSREPRPKLAAAIERVTLAMARASKGRLPVVYRTDLVQACRECAFAQKCLGEKAVASHFPIVTGPDLADSEGGHAD